jgi:hypothetical protein
VSGGLDAQRPGPATNEAAGGTCRGCGLVLGPHETLCKACREAGVEDDDGEDERQEEP